MLAVNDDMRWRAVVDRDVESDGSFVYAVRSTGIYCRPTCPSRRPSRRHVQFFSGPDVAERAGFRACRRCEPRSDRGPQQSLVDDTCRAIEARLDRPFTLSDVGREIGASASHIQRVFKQATGITPRQYAEARRLERFKERLQAGESITESIYEAGYGSTSRLYERVDRQLGMTPRTYRRGGWDMRISYAIAPCRLGRVLVAATDRGVCAVYLGDNDTALIAELRSEFPEAGIHAAENLNRWIDPLAEHLDGRRAHLDLPLDIQATAFQWQVWDALRRIPYGTTATYAGIARALGKPGSARAVARACATNPTSVLIPCHRVVRGDGKLGGYRWGVDRKQALLEAEHSNTQPVTPTPSTRSA